MGNSVFDGNGSALEAPVSIHKFYSPSAWIDGKAEQQLHQVANLKGVSRVAAFPDLHPGKYGPVGVAILADRVYPELIGNDIGCGMALFALDLRLRKLSLDKAERRLRGLAEVAAGENGFGTIGGGNHFCELQRLKSCDEDAALDTEQAYLLVHSGSRGFGNAIFDRTRGKLVDGYLDRSSAESEYATAHDEAVRWAAANRAAIAEVAADCLRAEATLIADVPHNLVEKSNDGWLHRKGAARADAFVPLAGSRNSESYLVQSMANIEALRSLAHGAGRRYTRSHMRDRMKQSSALKAEDRNAFGGRLICDDRQLRAEESGDAYKAIGSVVGDLETFGVAKAVAEFQPLVTFKTAKVAGGENDK